MRGGAEAARQAHNLEVGGSNPSLATIILRDGAEAARQAHNLEVEGSNPSLAITKNRCYLV